METHWTLILKWEQLRKHRERKREVKGREEWSRPGEALGSGNCVPSLLCVFSFVLADGSAFVVGFFPYRKEETRERGRDSLRDGGRVSRQGVREMAEVTRETILGIRGGKKKTCTHLEMLNRQ